MRIGRQAVNTLQLAREMLKAGMSLERAAAAIGVKTSLLDRCLWLAVGHEDFAERRAVQILDTAKENWS